jgi:DNA invertase Pin-like site-specific DNA recombinase
MKAALYVRVSTTHQIDKDSLPFQRKELTNYSKYFLGIDDYEIFEDAGYSGKNTDRPKFKEMMSRIRAGEFTHLLVWKIDRISRNLKDFTTMYEELKSYNTAFISKNEQFDTSSAMGEAMLKIILVFAELERNLTSERVSSIMLDRASEGKWNGAPVPLGYQWSKENKFPVVNEDEAKIIKYIFDSYERTRSTNEVKHLLEVEGYKTKRNGTWTTKTLSDVIRNPFYMGTYRYNYRYSPHGKKRPEKEWVVVEDNHEGIISKDQYERCNQIMDKNAIVRGIDGKRTSHIHVFSGLISCGKCEKNYIASLDRRRQTNYRPSVYRCHNYVHSSKKYRKCNGGIGEVKLGPFVINYLVNLISASNLIESKGFDATTAELEETLLNGKPFAKVVGIENIDSVYDIFQDSFNAVEQLQKTGTDGSDVQDAKEYKAKIAMDALAKEKKKIERALDRLESIYYFDDEGMSQKDYLIKKKRFEEKLKETNKKIKKMAKEFSQNLPGYNLEFIKKATQFLLYKVGMDNFIDYNKLVQIIDKSILRDFMKCNIKKIVIEEDRTISSIEFINGMVHRFIYN